MRKTLLYISILTLLFFLTSCGEIKEYGTTPGNASRVSGVVEKGNWIYYISNHYIFKMNPKGDQVVKVCDAKDNVFYLNVVDDWLVYREGDKTLCKIRTDGTEQKTLLRSKETISTILVADDEIYYKSFGVDESNKGIYKMGLDGQGKEKISEIRPNYFWVEKDYIYVTDGDKLKRLNRGIGSDVDLGIRLHDSRTFQVANGWIYYIPEKEPESNYIWRMKTNGKEKTKVLKGVKEYNVTKEGIYYLKDYDENKICVTDFSGKELKSILLPFSAEKYFCGGLQVTSDWFFFNLYQSKGEGELVEPQAMYRIRKDGSDLTKIETPKEK